MKILQKIQGVKFAEKFERFEIFLGKDLFHERSKQGYEAFSDNFLKPCNFNISFSDPTQTISMRKSRQSWDCSHSDKF